MGDAEEYTSEGEQLELDFELSAEEIRKANANLMGGGSGAASTR